MDQTVRRRLLLPVALLGATAACYSGSRPPRVGLAAKDFTLKDSDRTVTLSQFRGQIVLLNFWATWCPPCVEEIPSMIDMQEHLRSRGVVVLGVSIDVDDDAYHRFLKQRKVNFLTVRDPEQKIATMYGTAGWPETYVIDRQGVMRRKFVGPVNWDSPEVIQFLSKL
jgi:cytochrome c biogenesis protein CcmG, thiol:disulfide interchange protein DsbE